MTGFRQPLSVEDYIDALGDDEAELTHVMTLGEGYGNSGPRRWGNGPTQASLSTALARRDDLVWDTNRYYRDLGFADGPEMVLGGYRAITRKDILRVIKSRGAELQESRQTFCAKKLLNRSGRPDYDATVLGQVVFDEYWEEFFKREAEREASNLRKQGMDIDVASILESWGLDVDPGEPEDMGLDFVAAEEEPPPPIESDWDWPFFVWSARSVNLSYMQEWQRLLHNAIRQNQRMGARYLRIDGFAVGVMGFGNSPSCPETIAEVVDDELVFFLRSDVIPTKQLARQTIKQLLLHNINTGVRV